MTLTRGYVRNAVTTPLDVRLMDLGRLITNADGSARVGVLGVLNAPLLTALGTMRVSMGQAIFVSSKNKGDGSVVFANDGTIEFVIGTAPVSNSRIDVMWVRHMDSTTGDPGSTPVAGVTQGTAAASPIKPAIPTGATEVGTLRVYAGTTAANGGSNTLTETYQMTAAQGGVVPFRRYSDLLLWTNPADGQIATVLDDNSGNPFYSWNGTAWKRMTNLLGMVSLTTPTQGGIAGAEVAVTGASVTFELPRAGRVRVSGQISTYSGTVAELAVIRIKEGAAVLSDTVRAANSSPTTGGTSNVHTFSCVLPAVTAGTHTYALYLLRAAGPQTITAAPGDASPTQLIVEMLD